MKFLLLTLIFWNLNSWSVIPSELTDRPCVSQIEKTLRKHKSSDQWMRVADLDETSPVYRSPTAEFGTWVELQYTPDPRLFVFSGEKTRFYQFAPKGCATVFNTDSKPLPLTQIRGEVFSDNDLKSLYEKESFSLIYLWSPRSLKSILGLTEMQMLADKLKLGLFPVADPSQSAEDVAASFKKRFPRSRSVELFFRSGSPEYPAVLLVGKKKFSPVIPISRIRNAAPVLENELASMKDGGQ